MLGHEAKTQMYVETIHKNDSIPYKVNIVK